ncbi:hypothetical protein HH310_19815 [Actinoplanes sp. TBRC 11911]|uniref:hypothetical protein n=1 Tax=Actinoplanes sp. TBRC 11911 TaxID=2729386 RepID=UPI00145E9B25|nr:hypothetical protein [Actinoplanes sp. TBRC 11911]NMO53424.1 hypothetical protein [Actinoplanes sp. TBRC 11911]
MPSRADPTAKGVFLALVFGHPYRVTGVVVFDNGALGALGAESDIVRTGEPTKFFVGYTGTNMPSYVRLNFWPPNAGDSGELWTCRCGRPLDDAGALPAAAVSHWQMIVRVPGNFKSYIA